jgi:hypothetical protein
LRLERHALGEDVESERHAIDAHLASCAACAACLRWITEDDARALPPLPPALPAPARARSRVFVAAGALALAAAALLAVGREWGGARSAATSRVKGGAVAFSLVRDDGERFNEAGGSFRDGDRFKALVTCPPGMNATFDLVVYDDGGVSFPMSTAHDFACGNDAPLPGAFRLTGAADERVCLVWSEEGPVDRASLAGGVTPFGERAQCKALRPIVDSSP